jgi:Cu+-exporting ATPase
MQESAVDVSDLAAAAADQESLGRSVSWLALCPIARPTTATGDVLAAAAPPVLLGMLSFGDTPKPEAATAVAELQKMGLRTVLLTGDNAGSAQHLANLLHITEVHSQVLPADKSACVERLKAEGCVAMVGDGINDAPALAAADVGIAMAPGGQALGGSDAAMQAAGVTLLRGDLHLIAQTFNLSGRTIRKIRQNLFWALAYNVVGIPLAAFGLLSPMVAGAAMALSSVSVVANTLLLGRRANRENEGG